MTLLSAYAKFKASIYWTSTGKINHGFGVANSGEAQQLDAYIGKLDAGNYTAVPPTLASAFGAGIVGMLAALAAKIPTAPQPPTVTKAWVTQVGSTLYANWS